MSGFKNVLFDPDTISLDAGSRLRSSQIYTLGDYKTLGADEPYFWENTISGTGATGTWASNAYNMAFSASPTGSYVIRRTSDYHHYFSGKSMQIECSFDNFQNQTNTTKRVGYFSSNNATPYDSSKDGFWLENDGTNVRLRIQNNGTDILNVAQSSFNVNTLSGYDWSNFTVVLFDFLWLGGAVLRLFVKTSTGFTLAHTYVHAGTATGMMIQSPNQCVRYELRSTGTATSSFRAICAQVATEGDVALHGKIRSISNRGTAFAGVTAATIGTTYAVIGVQKATGFRDRVSKIIDASCYVSSNTDVLNVSLILNPTVTGTFTYSALTNSSLQVARPTGALAATVTGGTEILSFNVFTNTVPAPVILPDDNLARIAGVSIADVSDSIVLCVTPITAGVTLFANMRVKEY